MLRILLLALGVVSAVPAYAEEIRFTDIAGREVVLERPAQRVVLGEARDIIALALIHPDPVGVIAGWPDSLKKNDAATYEAFRTAFRTIDRIPVIGTSDAGTFSVEKVLSEKPDLVIFSSGHGPNAKSEEVLAQLEAGGVPVMFIDFSFHPLEHTLPSMELLGKALGREAEARQFVEFYRKHQAAIAEKLAAAQPARPKVFLHMHAVGWDCCFSPGKGNLGDFIDFVGGHNIGADVLPNALGQLQREFVLAADPDVYIATGGPHMQGHGGLVVGTGVTEEAATRDLAKVAANPDIADLRAVRNGRVHGLWHHFYASPLNILALESLAAWVHPELFGDLDRAATFREIQGLLPLKLNGTYWVDGL